MTKTPILIALVLAAAACSTPDPDAAAPNAELTEQTLTSLHCSSNADCEAAAYCALPSGQCSGAGTCTTRPRACLGIVQPVCGCDGKTYGNDCEAARAGANVAHQAKCGDVKPALAGPTCGGRVCPAGQICCNASCGTCVPKGWLCSQQSCN